MNCDEARQHWHLFHDSEGEATSHLQINEHLRTCPACSRWFFRQSQLEEAVAEKLREGPETDELWRTIHAQIAVRRPLPSHKWLVLALPALLAASVLVALAIWPIGGKAASPDLASLSTEIHERLAAGQQRVAFISRSDHEVENYLRERVPFPVRCPPRGDAGFHVEGGGTCQLARDAAAYVVGRVDGQPVSVFIMDQRSLSAFPTQHTALQAAATYQSRHGTIDVVMGQIDQNVVMVVGSLDGPRLRKVLSAYGTYHEHELPL